MSKIKLSQAFLVAASSLELLLFPFVGPLFIFTLYLIGALSFIFSISKTKLMFVLLTCLPMLFVFVEQMLHNERSMLLMTTLCVDIPWVIAVILACLTRGNFPNPESESYGGVEKIAIYILAIIPFCVAILFINML